MQLMLQKIEKKLAKYPLYSQEDQGFDARIVVKYFDIFGGGTWLITEGTYENGRWLFFGYITLDGVTWEWGYVYLNELLQLNVKFPRIERDLHMQRDITVRQYLQGK